MNTRHKAYGKLLRALIMLAGALYEMVYNEAAPSMGEVLK